MCHSRRGELLDEVCHYDTSLCVTVFVENCWMIYVIMTPVHVSQSLWRKCRMKYKDCNFDTSQCVAVVVEKC